MSGLIYTHAELTADLELRCDVCIIGSGAGGAVLAAGLCAAGLDVVMLEEGSRVGKRDFTLRERDAYPLLYQDRGTRATDDLGVTVMQGRSVGGSTTINWTTCFRTPERILAHWERVHGIEGLDAETLRPHFELVEQRLNIGAWPEEIANANNRALLDGARKLGWSAEPLRRNVKGCANSGYCGVGCPVDGKQAMGITYIDDALAAGLRLVANVRVGRIVVSGGRAVAVHAQRMRPEAGAPDGARVVVKPKVVVSSAGAINGPALLLRSGITGGGRVGRRTFLHPVVGSLARFAEPVVPWQGAPQSVGSHQHIDRGADKVGFFLEAAPLQPMLAAVAFNRFGPDLHTLMSQLPHANALLALMVDGLLPGDEGGTVRITSSGQPKLAYPSSAALAEGFRAGQVAMAQVQLAAGAAEVMSLHTHNVRLTTDGDLSALEAAPYGIGEHAVFSAHQMGGCAMAPSADRGVVDPQHRSFEVPNLFVVDGSVLPTALGVNPSETIYGLSRRATRFVAEAV